MRYLILVPFIAALSACSLGTQSYYYAPEEGMAERGMSYNDDPFLRPIPQASDRCPEAMPTGGAQPSMHEGTTWDLFCAY